MSLKLSLIDKRVIDHIAENGSTTDQIGKELIVRFVRHAMKNPTIRAAADKHDFDAEDLCVIYATMIDSLMPNPTIMSGMPMLAASVPFIEPFRIEAFMSQVRREFTQQMSPFERREVIRQYATVTAHTIFDSHTAARGEAPFRINPAGTGMRSAGCVGVIVVAFTVAAAVSFWLSR